MLAGKIDSKMNRSPIDSIENTTLSNILSAIHNFKEIESKWQNYRETPTSIDESFSWNTWQKY